MKASLLVPRRALLFGQLLPPKYSWYSVKRWQSQLTFRNKSKRNTNRIMLSVVSSLNPDSLIAPLLCVSLDNRKYLIGSMGELTQMKFRSQASNYGGKSVSVFLMPPSLQSLNAWGITAGLFGYLQSSGIQNTWGLHAPKPVISIIKKSHHLFSGSPLRLDLNSFSSEDNADATNSFYLDEPEFCTIKGNIYSNWSFLSFNSKEAAGVFNADKALALGVPFGPSNGKLCAGEAVLSKDGTTWIYPHQVVGPPRKRQYFYVLGCSSLSALNQMSKHVDSFSDVYPTCIIHILEKGIWGPEYIKFLSHPKFSRAQHFISCIELASNNPVFQRNKGRNVLPACRDFAAFDIKPSTLDTQTQLPENTYVLKEETSMVLYDEQCKISESPSYSPVKLAKKFSSFNPLPFENEGYTLDVLGTSATCPTWRRSLSSYSVAIDGTVIMLDCGEGAISQFFRQYGTNTEPMLRKLKAIFITHLHSDHYLGLLNVLQAWNKANTNNSMHINIIGPKFLWQWLQRLKSPANLQALLNRIIFIIAKETVTTPLQLTSDLSISSVPSIHINDSYSCIISHTKYGKLVYSGDTRPNEKLVKAGIGASLLLHESTFEDDLKHEAIQRQHSTASEALSVAQSMKAKALILTHFSQRSYDADFLPPDWTIYPKSKTIYANDGLQWQQFQSKQRETI
ncbi:mitochondrial 3'-tRNA processing endonuclease tRNAse Z, Trz2 [Schizosaccharomyces pombe]|uniref:Ribonuclease Z 2, mitochondrial n=1 Tax=Schizosaccharomyces pombe (strain 972 / ATCC 24843) TaxID=284812 RepID=RNZ2_SCHPO|nr:3'-tRNA-processing endonuclease Trz2 [Schizosaccharomyces pombe]P87168.1 RecName: Full=Ribonuclease Z 2, mitochondrial; Short=RNase Z 2; AltName: Full=tRNA 3 endonuclease 2; AltName: Full=tRNase Z 2; Flags: Precursor [Schizosaccharomyces pombe 972h-]CAB09123.1 mitochondrial 3'-tRNA processing endonuclease Trz2 [Schizosaccharomyces pombe]|eukprot:NP_595514.1 3'-tRNA-processing endonuclease Trz2 [Schizosaccharomyces pombe]